MQQASTSPPPSGPSENGTGSHRWRQAPALTWTALAVLAAVATSGCASVATRPVTSEAVTPPEAWRATETVASAALAPEDLALWWQQLGDSTLDGLVERALSGSLDLQSALARVSEARARRGVARAALAPTVEASASATRSDPQREHADTVENYSTSLETAWEVDLFGANRATAAASEADLEASVEELHGARVALIAEVVTAYVELRVSEAQLGVLDASIASRLETWQLTAWRQQAGLASALELAQTVSNLEQARANRPALEQSAAEARLRLELLAGESPGGLDDLLPTARQESAEGEGSDEVAEGEARAAIPQPPATVAVAIPADCLRQRPDVRAAERELAAAVARLGAAEAARFPSLRLTGSLNAQGITAGDLFDADSLISNLVASLTAPIFEGGRIRQNIAIQDALVEQAALSYRQTVLEALSEVESALSAFGRTQERIAALEKAVLAAGEAAELAGERYEAGLVDLLTVLDAQRTQLSLDEQLTAACGELATTFASLYRAFGGGWTTATTGESHA